MMLNLQQAQQTQIVFFLPLIKKFIHYFNESGMQTSPALIEIDDLPHD